MRVLVRAYVSCVCACTGVCKAVARECTRLAQFQVGCIESFTAYTFSAAKILHFLLIFFLFFSIFYTVVAIGTFLLHLRSSASQAA